ncbi:hypothetical protein pdam_00004396 [Pocillopora damicornis]|uniref:Uncharacterized protein n=1 Tax=Pocillopora damicornis TaxID=46731 RepID=A0A3M6UJ00_POCDA|nr:hypothetical protein pdam_00004396 [Pocillopora damicornis]
MSMEKSVLRTALTFGVTRRFLVPKCFILYSACVQVYTSATGAAPNQGSPAFLRASVSPSPSVKSIARTTRLVVETTALKMFNSTNMSLMNMPKPSSEVLVSSRQTTVVIESSIRTSTNFRGNGEPTNRVRVEHADEDKSVVFYRKVLLVKEGLCKSLRIYRDIVMVSEIPLPYASDSNRHTTSYLRR